MKLVVGLGNPGSEYRGTRHNAGFEVVDRLLERHGIGQQQLVKSPADALLWRWRQDADPVYLAKPLTFMNLSGGAVRDLARFYKIGLTDVLVVCDDVNLPVGRLRARASGTEGGHNGLRSVADVFGTIEYPRLRIGVGRGDARRDLADHVLARFSPDEAAAVQGAIDRAADAVETWVSDGLPVMMNRFNRAADSGSTEDANGAPKETEDDDTA